MVARKGRVEFAGAVYHLWDRGDRREAIFRDETDHIGFVTTLGEACVRTGWRVHAFVLMSNHYHLLVETPQANLIAGMRWFQTTWTARFNRRHGLCGHLFQGRYKAVVVDPEQRSYFAHLSDYIHLNPVRAGIVGLEQRLFDYRWSSYPLYAAKAGRPTWFGPEKVLGELGLEDTVAGRRHYAERMRRRAVEERAGKNQDLTNELRRGWCLGGPAFRERVLSLMERAGEKLSRRKEVDAAVQRSHDEHEATGMLSASINHYGMTREDLRGLKKNDPRKLAIARLIRRNTAVANGWISQELGLGHVSAVSRCLKTNAALGAAEATLLSAIKDRVFRNQQ
jgi:REP element-mobilizing transposase RayT